MARIMKRVVRLVATTSILSGIALYVYTLPGLRRLPKAKQRSLDGVTTIDDAVRHLQNSGKTGWALVAAAQTLVNAKMEYSRRNGWDTAPRAFGRGMGYCQKHATALLLILCQLGIAARPVQALRCKFPPARIHEYWDPGGISGHMWLVVSIDGVEKDVCPGHPDNAPGKVHFEVLSRTTAYGPVLRLFGHIGSMILNRHRDNAALRTMRRQKAETRLEAITARRFLRGIKRQAEAPLRSMQGDQPLSFMERIKTRIEHEADTRSIGLAASLIRLTKGRIARLWRRQVLLLTTRGRKSGQERTVPLQFFPDGDDMIVVAANSGLPSPPGWYFNLTADPVARVEVGNRTLHVRAQELSADEAATFSNMTAIRMYLSQAVVPCLAARRGSALVSMAHTPLALLHGFLSTGCFVLRRPPASALCSIRYRPIAGLLEPAATAQDLAEQEHHLQHQPVRPSCCRAPGRHGPAGRLRCKDRRHNHGRQRRAGPANSGEPVERLGLDEADADKPEARYLPTAAGFDGCAATSVAR